MEFTDVFTPEKYDSHQSWLKTNGKEGKRLELVNANLSDANLCDANLQGANLHGAYLSHSDLSGADIDFSAWPLHCGSFDAKVDKRIVVQLIYHVCRLNCDSLVVKLLQWIMKPFANQFHRIGHDVIKL